MPRHFASQDPQKEYDFVKESSKKGPVRWVGLLATVMVGGAAVYYVKQAKDEMEKSMANELILSFLDRPLYSCKTIYLVTEDIN